jgi:hypothetical protein
MCRNIRTLFNFDPPATDEEIRAASRQFVRKLSGFNAPSKTNEAAFNRSVEEVFRAARHLVDSLLTRAPGARPSGGSGQGQGAWRSAGRADAKVRCRKTVGVTAPA